MHMSWAMQHLGSPSLALQVCLLVVPRDKLRHSANMSWVSPWCPRDSPGTQAGKFYRSSSHISREAQSIGL